MADQQLVYITARTQDEAVVLSSGDPRLKQGSDGAWTFTITRETPPEVVFRLDIIDSNSNGWLIRSALRASGDTWGAWVTWPREGVYVSPAFVHGNDFRLEVTRSKSSTSTVRGGGFYQIRDEGGGGF